MSEEGERKKIKLESGGDVEINKKIEFKKDDGWVSLVTLLKFVRLQQLTKDEQKLVEALKEHESEVIEFDEGKKSVRRRKPLPDLEDYQKQLDLRTVHISGFPTDSSFDSLRRYCTQFGEVESVAMRRHFKTRAFKGCIHVVFKKEEDAKKVLESEILKCKDRELKKEDMKEYRRRKAEILEKKKKHRDSSPTKDKSTTE